MKPEIEIHGSVKNLSSAPDIAFEYQPDGSPWPSVAAAHLGTPEEFRAVGKRRIVDNGSGMREYWYNGGVALENLVLRFETSNNTMDYLNALVGITSSRTRAQIRALTQNTEELIRVTDLGLNIVAVYSPTDSTSLDDGENTLVDGDGRRFMVTTFFGLISRSFNSPIA